MLKIRDKDGQFEYESLTENKYLEQVIFGKAWFINEISEYISIFFLQHRDTSFASCIDGSFP